MKRFYNEAAQWTEAVATEREDPKSTVRYHAKIYKDVLKKLKDIHDLDTSYHDVMMSIESLADESSPDEKRDSMISSLLRAHGELEKAHENFLKLAKKILELK